MGAKEGESVGVVQWRLGRVRVLGTVRGGTFRDVELYKFASVCGVV
jgi:hypothetical protein